MRLPDIALTVLELSPDIVLLTEFRKGRGGQLAGVLADHGWIYQASTAPANGGNGLLLASRLELIDEACPEPPGPSSSKWIERRVSEWDLVLVGVHIPHRGSGTARTSLWKHAVDRARVHRGGRCILLGDFNTGRNGLDGPKDAFDCTQRLGELAALRYTDAWRKTYPQGRDGTWTSHTGDSHRIDHAHCSEGVRGMIQAVWHEKKPVNQGLSDHSPLLVRLCRE